MIQINSINNSDFPALFNAADEASLSAQQKYLLLVKSDLAILVVSALMSSWSPNGADPLAIPSAILITVGIFITYLLSSSKHERVGLMLVQWLSLSKALHGVI
ncbi:MAG: hypothetical protein HC862_00765 [Scytonema sp. RU_4_4]|nr:hypothetical protein [Scytonema sp. RU_4_4]